MTGEYWELVGEILDAIERDIKTPLTLDGISLRFGLSKFHLHRLFRALTGMSLMAYVRGRKLTRSLGELMDTNWRIVDIACEYGFDYEQSYERAFKQLFRVSPSGFRRDRPQLAIVQPPRMEDLQPIGQGLVILPTFVLKPQFYLMGMEAEIVHAQNYLDSTANKLAMDFIYNRSHLVPNAINSHVYYGLVRYSPNPAYSNDYMPSLEVASLDTLPLCPGFCGYTLPSHVYAVFRYVGLHGPEEITMRTLTEIYNYIDKTWLPSPSRRQSDPYHFERIDRRICSSEYCQADIYIPVEG